MFYSGKNEVSNNNSVLNARVLTVPGTVTKLLADARIKANEMTNLLMAVDAAGNHLYTTDSREFAIADVELNKLVTDYNAKFLLNVYDAALASDNPIVALATIGVVDEAKYSTKLNQKTGNMETKVTVAQKTCNLDDFVDYAIKTEHGNLYPEGYIGDLAKLYNDVICFRLQEFFLNASSDDDSFETAIDTYAKTMGKHNAWKATKELTTRKAKRDMKQLLYAALNRITNVSTTGKDFAWLVDVAVLGAAKDIYSLRFCKPDTFYQRVFEILIAKLHDLDIQLTK